MFSLEVDGWKLVKRRRGDAAAPSQLQLDDQERQRALATRRAADKLDAGAPPSSRPGSVGRMNCVQTRKTSCAGSSCSALSASSGPKEGGGAPAQRRAAEGGPGARAAPYHRQRQRQAHSVDLCRCVALLLPRQSQHHQPYLKLPPAPPQETTPPAFSRPPPTRTASRAARRSSASGRRRRRRGGRASRAQIGNHLLRRMRRK